MTAECKREEAIIDVANFVTSIFIKQNENVEATKKYIEHLSQIPSPYSHKTIKLFLTLADASLDILKKEKIFND